MPAVEVVVVQGDTRWHDPPANRTHYGALLDAHARAGALVLLPETFSTGFTMAVPGAAEPDPPPTLEWMRARARRHRCVVAGSLALATAEGVRNRFYWVPPDGAPVHYDKRHRFRMAGEHEHYAAGDRRVVVRWGGLRFLLTVCYDLRFPVFCRAREDYDVLVCVANWPAARRGAWNTLLAARAIENQVFAVGVNRTGRDGNGVVHDGGSAVHGPDGASLVPPLDGEAVAAATLDGAALGAFRDRFPAWRDRDAFALHGVTDVVADGGDAAGAPSEPGRGEHGRDP